MKLAGWDDSVSVVCYDWCQGRLSRRFPASPEQIQEWSTGSSLSWPSRLWMPGTWPSCRRSSPTSNAVSSPSRGRASTITASAWRPASDLGRVLGADREEGGREGDREDNVVRAHLHVEGKGVIQIGLTPPVRTRARRTRYR